MLIVGGLSALDYLRQRLPSLAVGVAVAAVLLPVRNVAPAIAYRSWSVPREAVQWVERTVPPGTIVYCTPGLYNLLPTEAAADACWDEVTANAAWKRKFEWASGGSTSKSASFRGHARKRT